MHKQSLKETAEAAEIEKEVVETEKETTEAVEKKLQMH